MTDKPAPKKKPKNWGKGKTDPDTWWEKGGPSPNPKGRPKGSKNQKTIYKQASEAKVDVTVDGKKVTMTKKEAAYHQMVQQATAGNLKAMAMMMGLDEKYDPPELVPPTPEESAADYATLEAWIERGEKFKVFKKKEDDDA